MGIIHDTGDTSAIDILEATRCSFQRAQYAQGLAFLHTTQHSGTVYGHNVVGVEASHQTAPHLAAIDHEVHALKGVLQYLATVVGVMLQAIGMHLGLSVLHHDAPILVIHIH